MMMMMMIFRAPNVFACAVAGAPVSSWDGYDTHYTGMMKIMMMMMMMMIIIIMVLMMMSG
jgi:hypothetical protein